MHGFLIRFVKDAYLHFAAVVGAIALLRLASTVTEIQLYGVILTMVDWWAETVRPLIAYLYAPIVGFLSSLLEVELALPVWALDYLGVGVALILSRLRGAFEGWRSKAPSTSRSLDPKPRRKRIVASILRKPALAIFIGVKTLLVWPLELVLMTRLLLFAESLFPEKPKEYIAGVRKSHAITLLPVLYFVVLVLANWALALFPNLRAHNRQ